MHKTIAHLLLLGALALLSVPTSAQQPNNDLKNCKGPVPDGAFSCKGTVWCDPQGTYMCCVPNKEGGRDCDQIEAKVGGGTKGVVGAVRGGTLAPVTGQTKPPVTGQTNYGNTMQAAQGYVFSKGPAPNQVTARKAGSQGTTLSCICKGGQGKCSVVVTNDTKASCDSHLGPDVCKGGCAFIGPGQTTSGNTIAR